MNASRWNLKILFFICLLNFFEIRAENKRRYFIRSQNINVSDLKNAVKIPNYAIFNVDIISETTTFLKRNIFSWIYPITGLKQYYDLKGHLIDEYKKNLINVDQVKTKLYNELNTISNQHLTLKFRKFFNPKYLIYSKEDLKNKRENINKYFQDIGFLDSSTTTEVNFDKNYATVFYNITEGKSYYINLINIVSKNTEIKKIITEGLKKSKLKTKQIFNKYKIAKFKEECINELRNNGYFNFYSDNLKIYVHKNLSNHNVDIYFHVNCNEDNQKKYIFGETIVKYKPNSTKKENEKKKIIYSISEPIKKKTIYKMLKIKKGTIYKKNVLDDTYLKLLDTNIFKTIDIDNNINNDSIDTSINLTFKKKFSIEHSIEIDLNMSNLHITNNLSFLFRNLFKHMEILTASIEYSKVIPYEIKNISFFKQYRFNSLIKASYPFSIIFQHLCYKTEISFSFNKESLDLNNKKNRTCILGNISHLFKFKKNIELESNINFLNIEKNNKEYIQTKSITFTNNIDINDIYKHNVYVNLSMVFTSNKYIFLYKAMADNYQRKKLNFIAKIEYNPTFTINIKNDFKINFSLKIGDIFSYKPKINDNLYFQLGGNEILKAWELGEVGPGYKKTGKGSILFAAITDFNYEINNNIHGQLFLECGNIWTKRKNKIINKGDFVYNCIIFQQIYADGGISLIFITGILKIKFDIAIKIYSPNKSNEDIYKIRLNIIK